MPEEAAAPIPATTKASDSSSLSNNIPAATAAFVASKKSFPKNNDSQSSSSSTATTTTAGNNDNTTTTATTTTTRTDTFPTTSQEADLVEAMLQEELSKLSLVEHEQSVFDVHGIAHIYEEDPQTMKQCLTEMRRQLQETMTIDKAAYQQALYLNPSYVEHDDFAMMFLRSERFDPKRAALKVLQHFQLKEELFGRSEVLGRDVCLSDLSEDDLEPLECGAIQLLPIRDASGRSIVSIAPAHKKHKQVDHLSRAMWYLLSVCLKDEEAQKKGIVAVVYNTGTPSMVEEFETMRRCHRVREALPKRVAAIHYCTNNEAMRPFVTGAKLFMDNQDRARVRTHFGSHETIQFELQTYGIPMEHHPMNEMGELSLGWHLEWLQSRRAMETRDAAEQTNCDHIIIPRRFDVLFGRGKHTREHTGNLRAAHLVEMHQSQYEQANKHQKTVIAERVVCMIHESYGRFLKWDKGGWEEVSSDAAREKVSHFFRHLRSKATTTTTKPAAASTSTSSTSKEIETEVTPAKTATLKHAHPATTVSPPSPNKVSPCASPGIDEMLEGRAAKHIKSSS